MKKLLRVLAGESLSPPPLWLMRQAGRYLPEYRALREKEPNFLQFCLTPELCTTAALQPLERFPQLDAAILFSDILIVPAALGCTVRFLPGPVLDPVGLDFFDTSIQDSSYAFQVFEAVRCLKKVLPSEKTLIGFCGAPWTLAAYMIEGTLTRDFGVIRSLALREPERFKSFLKYISSYLNWFIKEQIEAGAEAIQIFDTWASFVPPPYFEEFVLEPLSKVMEGIGVPVLLFCRGVGWAVDKIACRFPQTTLSVDAFSPLYQAIPNPLQGYLDNGLLAFGSMDRVEIEVRNILKVMKNRPFIFNLSHGILPSTDPKRVEKVLDWVTES